jgi:two-component system sensor histidine kinase/response regulator
MEQTHADLASPHASLDVSLGLQRTGGRKALYRMLLGLYAEQNAATGLRIRDSLGQGDRQLAERLAHTLKGSSAQVGACGVERRAAAVELSLREGAPSAEVEPLLAALEQALDDALDCMRAGFEPATPQPA